MTQEPENLDIQRIADAAIEGMILYRSRHPLINRRMRQNGFNLWRTHVCRMSLGVKQNEAIDPIDRRLFSPQGIVLHPQPATHLIE